MPVRNGHCAQRAARSQLQFAFGGLPIGAIGPNEVQQWISQMAIDGDDVDTMRAKRSLLKSIVQVAVDQGWLTHNPVDRARLPRPVEQPDEDRVVTPEEWAQIRIHLSGEGTLMLCDLTLDCGLRYEEVTALRPVDVVDGDARNANHVWVRQAVNWAGREFTGLTEPWSIGPTKGKRFRKVARLNARVRPAAPPHRWLQEAGRGRPREVEQHERPDQARTCLTASEVRSDSSSAGLSNIAAVEQRSAQDDLRT